MAINAAIVDGRHAYMAIFLPPLVHRWADTVGQDTACMRAEHAPGIRLCFAIQSQVVEAAQLQKVFNHVQGPSHLTEQQHPVPCTVKQP